MVGGEGPRGGDESVVSGQRSVTSGGAAGGARAGTVPASTRFMRGETGEGRGGRSGDRRFQRRDLDEAGVSLLAMTRQIARPVFPHRA